MRLWVDFGGGNSNAKRFRVRTAGVDSQSLGEFDEVLIAGTSRLWSPSVNNGILEIEGELHVDPSGTAIILSPRPHFEELPAWPV